MPGYRLNFGKYDGWNLFDVPDWYLKYIVANFTNNKSKLNRFWRDRAQEELERRFGKTPGGVTRDVSGNAGMRCAARGGVNDNK